MESCSQKKEENKSCCPKKEENKSFCPKKEDNKPCCLKAEEDKLFCSKTEENKSYFPKAEENKSCFSNTEENKSCCPKKEENNSCCPKNEEKKSFCSNIEENKPFCPKKEENKSFCPKKKDNKPCCLKAKEDKLFCSKTEENKSYFPKAEENKSCFSKTEENKSCCPKKEDSKSCSPKKEENNSCSPKNEEKKSFCSNIEENKPFCPKKEENKSFCPKKEDNKPCCLKAKDDKLFCSNTEENKSCSLKKSSPSSCQMKCNIQRVSPIMELGTGPHWNPLTQSLYFVDVYKKKLNKYNPETRFYNTAMIDCSDPLSFIIPVDNQPNIFLIGLGPAIGEIFWDGCSNKADYRYLKTIDNTPGNRLNVAKADASGRLWVGSMGPEIKDNPGHYHKCQGSLFSVECDGTVIKRLPNISISSGMAWSSDNKLFYYIDTYKYAVEVYDFDLLAGKICNGRVIFDFKCKNINGDPNGMTIDTDGNLWIACFNNDHILKVDPNTSTLLKTIELPAFQITSAAFGGLNLDQLYVTTASYRTTDKERVVLPYSGTLFQVVDICSTGFNGVPVKIDLCTLN